MQSCQISAYLNFLRKSKILFSEAIKFDGLVKSHKSDGTVKSSRCKARESLGMRHIYQYAAVTKDEAQRRPSVLLRAVSMSNGRWTFYEAVKSNPYPPYRGEEP
jgi:hypothetical protein